MCVCARARAFACAINAYLCCSAYKIDVEGFTLENKGGSSIVPFDFVVTVPVNLQQLPLRALGQLRWGLVGFRGERFLDIDHAALLEFGIMLSLSLHVCVRAHARSMGVGLKSRVSVSVCICVCVCVCMYTCMCVYKHDTPAPLTHAHTYDVHSYSCA